MRLTDLERQIIKQKIQQISGTAARVFVFGSRLDDQAKGGDIDLLVEVSEPINNPAELAAKISAQIMRALNGRKVDVLIVAPNLTRLPIHQIATQQGICL
jgi:predicted nucleotidyltransferase